MPCSGWMDRKLGLQISLRPVPDTCESPRLGYKKPSVMSGDMWAVLLFTPLIQSQIFRDSLLVLLPLSHRSRTITWLQHQLSTTDVRIKTASNYSTEMSSARPLMFPIWSMCSSVISMVTQLLNCYYPPLNLRPNLSTNIACPPRATIPLSW